VIEAEGLRGVALLIRHPGLFRPQIRALLQAAIAPGLQVLVPMVSLPEELDAVHGLFSEEAALLTKAGIPHGMPPIGIMVEVPSVLLEPERYPRAAFFSVGTNDLARSTGHGIEGVLAMLEPFMRKAATLCVPVNLCGDAASEPSLASALVGAGLRSLTVAPHALGVMADAIAAAGRGGFPATSAKQEAQA
jgi:phosphotransferase system enzyme I (PtsI)